MDKFENQKRIGKGSFSEVFVANIKGTKEKVAIKNLLLDYAGVSGSIIREVGLLKRLIHDNIVRLLEVIHEDNTELNLVFEYMPLDLKKLMNNKPELLTPSTIKAYMYKLLVAVEYCHSEGVIHRDLKPQNILIDIDNRVLKVADFGLARLLDIKSANLTPKVVTLWYRAPEILLGFQNYSFSSDMWSIGCIFGEMNDIGNPVFCGNNELNQLQSIFRVTGTPTDKLWQEGANNPTTRNFTARPPKDLEEVFPEMEPDGLDLISKMLQLDPKKRITAKKALEHCYFEGVNLD